MMFIKLKSDIPKFVNIQEISSLEDHDTSVRIKMNNGNFYYTEETMDDFVDRLNAHIDALGSRK